MLGGQSHPGLTVRSIINRGGEQGAQHSQALHSWFAHVPGLRVVMPSTVADARDLLIASVLCNDPVIYIDDRWLYDQEDELPPVKELELANQKPVITHNGKDITIVGSGHSSLLVRECYEKLLSHKIFAEIIDVRVLNPFNVEDIVKSVNKTKNLLVVDPGTISAGFSAEIIAKTIENIQPNILDSSPERLALPDAPAPTSKVLEKDYYLSTDKILNCVLRLLKK